jgi:hypothetical protein
MRLHLLTILLFVPLLFGFSDAYRWEGSEKNPIQLTQTEPNERHLVFFDEESREIQLCNLEVGQTYYIQMSQPQPCSPYFELDGVIYQPHKPIQFEATSSCQSFTVNRDYLKPSCDGGLYLTVMCTTCNLGGPSTLAPPIIATPGVPAQALVENVFIGGGCFDVTNVTYSGDPVARGQFFQGGTSIGLESGMVLSTGNVTTCTGPNNQTGREAQLPEGLTLICNKPQVEPRSTTRPSWSLTSSLRFLRLRSDTYLLPKNTVILRIRPLMMPLVFSLVVLVSVDRIAIMHRTLRSYPVRPFLFRSIT